MGLDDIKNKVGDLVEGNADKISEGIDKAGDLIDEKTGGKYSDKIDMVQEKAGDLLDKLGGGDE